MQTLHRTRASAKNGKYYLMLIKEFRQCFKMLKELCTGNSNYYANRFTPPIKSCFWCHSILPLLSLLFNNYPRRFSSFKGHYIFHQWNGINLAISSEFLYVWKYFWSRICFCYQGLKTLGERRRYKTVLLKWRHNCCLWRL